MALRLRMARSRIGLDIGATSVRAAEIRLNPPTLARVAQVRIPDGAVENGEVKDPGERALGRRLHRLAARELNAVALPHEP